MEVRKIKPVGPGVGYAGLELLGVRFVHVAVRASPQIKGMHKNSFVGFFVDYHSKAGYSKRIALSTGVFDKQRTNKSPAWGKRAIPDDYVDLGECDSYDLDLKQGAPPDWDGRLWFITVLEGVGGDTSLTAELFPLAKQPVSH